MGKNHYYLKHLAPDVRLYTFVESTKKLYKYTPKGKEHPNPDLLFYKLLYQAISRAREKLCVLVVENYKLFSDILNIKFDMLSRYQYKENYTNTTLSVKKLNRFTKKIKDKLSELEKNNAITISETVDIINDELMGAELKKKVVRNGLKLLQLICGKACAGSSID